MGMKHNGFRRGFALPTVLIASVILLSILAVAVTSTVTIRTSLKNQYYAQLAQVAGEAGVAYAKACLSDNGNIPQWTNAKPLMPNTDCTGTALSGITCPADDACFVTRNGTVRSTFKVTLPTVDGDGRAVTIPNTGITEITRASTGVVWRTYNQMTSQSAVVPDLCSSKTNAALGWNQVVTTTPSAALTSTNDARMIRVATSTAPGPNYYRKDFSVTQAGTYTLETVGDDWSSTYIDGRLVNDLPTTGSGGAAVLLSNTIDLDVGCHAIVSQVTNGTILNNGSGLTAALTLKGASKPLIVSDASWRVTSGTAQHYSSDGYFVSPPTWTAPRVIQLWSATTPVYTTVPAPAWNTTSGDTAASWISTTHSYTSTATYPASQTALFQDRRIFRTTGQTDIKLSYACDDTCKIYMDGLLVAQKTSGAANVVSTTTITAGPGAHQFGVSLTNASTAGSSGFLFAAQSVAAATIVSRSDASWYAATAWYATDPNPSSYDYAYQPTPNFYDCACDAQGTTNLIENPSMETSVTGWAAYTGLAAPTRVSTTPMVGSWRLSAVGSNTTTSPRVQYYVPVKGGDTITVSAYVRSDGQTPLNGLIHLKPRWNAGEISTFSANKTWLPDANGWSKVWLSATMPEGINEVSVGLGVSTAANYTGTLGVDGVMVTYGSNIPAYADGSSAGWMWLGTANSSVSSGPLL